MSDARQLLGFDALWVVLVPRGLDESHDIALVESLAVAASVVDGRDGVLGWDGWTRSRRSAGATVTRWRPAVARRAPRRRRPSHPALCRRLKIQFNLQ